VPKHITSALQGKTEEKHTTQGGKTERDWEIWRGDNGIKPDFLNTLSHSRNSSWTKSYWDNFRNKHNAQLHELQCIWDLAMQTFLDEPLLITSIRIKCIKSFLSKHYTGNWQNEMD